VTCAGAGRDFAFEIRLNGHCSEGKRPACQQCFTNIRRSPIIRHTVPLPRGLTGCRIRFGRPLVPVRVFVLSRRPELAPDFGVVNFLDVFDAFGGDKRDQAQFEQVLELQHAFAGHTRARHAGVKSSTASTTVRSDTRGRLRNRTSGAAPLRWTIRRACSKVRYCRRFRALITAAGQLSFGVDRARALPVAAEAHAVVDRWTDASRIKDGSLFRAIFNSGKIWGEGIEHTA